jgi:hypothetical protein
MRRHSSRSRSAAEPLAGGDHAAPEVVDLADVPEKVGDVPAGTRHHRGVQAGLCGRVAEHLPFAPQHGDVLLGLHRHDLPRDARAASLLEAWDAPGGPQAVE